MDETTKCISAQETRDAFLDLVRSGLCGDGSPCLRDECLHCGPVNALIDVRGDECVDRGCTLAKCIFD